MGRCLVVRFSVSFTHMVMPWCVKPRTTVNRTVTRALLGEAFPLRATVLRVMDELHRLQAAADLVGRRRRVALRRVLVAVADVDVT